MLDATTADALVAGRALTARRPRRADAARNFDLVLAAAHRLFDEHGSGVTMPQIAAAAGVGVATLYRSFSSREVLIEAVYVAEVEDLCSYGASLAGVPADDALDRWLRRFLRYMMSKRVLADGLTESSVAYRGCRVAIYAVGGALLGRAQDIGTAREDTDIDTVMRFVMAISLGVYISDAQREAVLEIALAGVHRTVLT